MNPCACVLLLSVPLLVAQAGGGGQTRFRTGVDVVEVAVLARDRDGRPVTDLTAADLQVLDDGVPQKIVAFERVSLPVRRVETVAGAGDAAPRDVASNEAMAESRVFMLVLDALHVAPNRISAVRRYAREFVERHVGPGDLAAVFTPGGLAAATEDFTTDKARLVAAIEQFTSTKLKSATVERYEEQQAAGDLGVPLHNGKDPSDWERADRVRSLANVLQALGRHAERIERRRKALLLFSEGIDYDVGDVMGTAQRDASAVMHAMHGAVAALMRTNVALYAIDPRALSTAAGDLLEHPVHATPDASLSPLGVETEHAASVRSLHYLAESTGGFSAVTNDMSRAFDRIVLESSEYYVLGYVPGRPPKAGEFRPISVRSSRPGVSIVARKGYALPRAVSTVRAETTPEPAMPMGQARTRASVLAAPPPAAAVSTGRLDTELADLLASPLPKSGLPIRVQAVAFRGNGRKSEVQLVVEVLGSGLRFADRGGRSVERIDVALLTVDARGRGANGRSATIDLRLPPEELQRVRTTGVRWLSTLELAPARYQIRVAARAAGSGQSGLVTQTVDVPGFDPQRLSLSGLTLTSLPSVLMYTKGKPWLEASLGMPPSAARRFMAGDRITAAAEVYVPNALAADPIIAGELDGPAGFGTRRISPQTDGRRDSLVRPVAFTMDTATLPPGRYLLRVAVARADGSERVQRAVPLEIVAAAR